MRELLRLLRYVRPYALRMAASVLLMAGVGVFEAITALLIVPVFDRVLNPRSGGRGVLLVTIPYWNYPVDLAAFVPSWIHNVWTVVAVSVLTVTFGKALFEYLAAYLVHYIGFAVISDLRNQVYEKVLRQSVRFFRDQDRKSVV